ncbi:hypothetical protein [Burkholderia vietnamiensis]|uniref:hypothetical protein n=1 Tax=Burkholderia vietnamiensis TaxID=60552 RepID=UPI001CB41D63|nr:hypothetical protein [Burkholderia vietnamiensis]CAG9229294.1 conserved hypothetical protein [Burkholderia vietnamiensis]HDR9086289.1 hypothetical protein [Burkholderia vietnamiensis]
MPRLHIPRLGTELILASDWTFRLFHEHRNSSLQSAIGLADPFSRLEDPWGSTPAERRSALEKSQWREADGSLGSTKGCYFSGDLQHPVTIPAGALMTIDRIFIRKGAADFDSVTFWLKAKSKPVTINGRLVKKSVRFWAKLDDVNAIEFEEKTKA